MLLEDGRLTSADGPLEDPDITFETDAATMGALVQARTTIGAAQTDGRLTITAPRAARRLLDRTFDLG